MTWIAHRGACQVGRFVLSERICLFALLLCIAVVGVRLEAQQVPVGNEVEDYVRTLQLIGWAAPGSMTLRPLSAERLGEGLDARHPWSGRNSLLEQEARNGTTGFFDPQVTLHYNTLYPRGRNEGAAWVGRGATVELAAGAYARLGPISLQVRPRVIHVRNRHFELAESAASDRNPFANPWHDLTGNLRIDLPQRFGPDAFTKVDPGDTELRGEWRMLAAGVSTTPMWWGPGIRNAIILSNNAPGFPHAFLGTARPVDVGVGSLEARWIWGRLANSDYFYAEPPADTADTRYFTGLAVAWQPSFLPGLTLGGLRTFVRYIPREGLDLGEYFLVFQGLTKETQATEENPGGDDNHDQVASIFARWVFPEAGFEAYVEWASNDHNWNLRDFIMEPEHSQAYTLGFQKTLPAADRSFWRLRGELTHLELSRTVLIRATPSYYAHYQVLHGYTHGGQVLGAGIGPGGNSQYLALDRFATWGRVGVSLERVVNDNDTYYRIIGDTREWPPRRDVELTGGVSALMFLGQAEASAALNLTRRLNRYYIRDNDRTNVNLRAGVRWRL